MSASYGLELLLTGYEAHHVETISASFLVTCHLLFNTICTQALASTTKLLNRRRVSVPDKGLNEILWTLLPLSVLTTATLVFGNAAYIQLNVAAIHMLKALTPVLVCILLFIAGISNITWTKCIDIVIVSGGIMSASAGWGQPASGGVAMQVAATSADAARLVVAERALAAAGLDMEPLDLVYHLAPLVCMASLVSTFPVAAPTLEKVLENWHLLLGSCLVSFFFDIAGFTVVGFVPHPSPA